MKLIGGGSPAEQIVASLVIAVAIIASSSISFGFTLALLPIPTLTLVIGIFRLVPAVDALYPL